MQGGTDEGRVRVWGARAGGRACAMASGNATVGGLGQKVNALENYAQVAPRPPQMATDPPS